MLAPTVCAQVLLPFVSTLISILLPGRVPLVLREEGNPSAVAGGEECGLVAAPHQRLHRRPHRPHIHRRRRATRTARDLPRMMLTAKSTPAEEEYLGCHVPRKPRQQGRQVSLVRVVVVVVVVVVAAVGLAIQYASDGGGRVSEAVEKQRGGVVVARL